MVFERGELDTGQEPTSRPGWGEAHGWARGGLGGSGLVIFLVSLLSGAGASARSRPRQAEVGQGAPG